MYSDQLQFVLLNRCSCDNVDVGSIHMKLWLCFNTDSTRFAAIISRNVWDYAVQNSAIYSYPVVYITYIVKYCVVLLARRCAITNSHKYHFVLGITLYVVVLALFAFHTLVRVITLVALCKHTLGRVMRRRCDICS
jgi:hypothetical protein